jgi:type IV pilus assembly protein PilC
MAVFAYRARNSDGVFSDGQIEAESRDEARRLLQEQGFFLQSLEPVGQRLSSGPRRGGSADAPAAPAAAELPPAPGLASLLVKVPLMQRCAFWRQGEQSVRAGLSLNQILDMTGQGHGLLAMWARRNLGRVTAGVPLSELMAPERVLFSALETAMVRAGEANGRLDVQMHRLAKHFEREMEVWNMLRFRLIYLGLTIISLFCSMFVVLVVAPLIYATQMGQHPGWTGPILKFCLPLVILAAVAFGLRATQTTSATLRFNLDRWKLQPPVIGPLFRKIAVARYVRALGDLIGAGLPIGEAAEIAAPTCGNLYLTAVLNAVPEQLRRGLSLTEALVGCCQMPDTALQMVRTGETTGSVDQLLDKLADWYEQEALTATQMLVNLGFVLSGLVMAIIVGIFAIHVVTGLYTGGIMGDLLK